MLGRTAGGVFWMFRLMERSENTARLIDAGFRIALTRSSVAENEWASVVATAGQRGPYLERHGKFEPSTVIDFLLRDKTNPSSVISAVEAARTNARAVRTALTREVWESVNESWMTLREALAKPVKDRDLPETLALIRQQAALVRGAVQGTMLRNDIYDFARLGTFLERADQTARLLDVKYYVLLPSARHAGAEVENVQWETVLRSVSALRAYRWLNDGEVSPQGIADLLILDGRMPRSLAFCYSKIIDNLGWLAKDYGERTPSHDTAEAIRAKLTGKRIENIFDEGLHETIEVFLQENNALGAQIERDYRFYE